MSLTESPVVTISVSVPKQAEAGRASTRMAVRMSHADALLLCITVYISESHRRAR